MNRPADLTIDGGFGPFLRSHLTASAFWMPDRIADSAWHEHVPFAFWLTEAVRPDTFVELGSHNGVSYCAVCQAVQRLSLPTRCFAVDTWKGDEHSGFYDEAVFRNLTQYHDQHYGRFSRLVRTTFDKAAGNFSDGSIDLLHIDGLHTYDAVAHDFETWLPKLSNRAVVMFHDTNVRERGFEVWRFWQEVSERYPSYEFAHGHGLGVLGVGPDQPRRMTALFAVSDDQLQYVQTCEVFAALGGALKRDHGTHKLREDLHRHADLYRKERARTAALEQENEELLARNNGLMVSQLQHKARADSLKGELSDMEAVLRRADTRHKSDVTRISNVTSKLKVLISEHQALTSEHQALTSEHQELSSRNADLARQNEEVLARCAELEAEVEEQRTVAERQQAELARHESKLAGLAGLGDQLRRVDQKAEALARELVQAKSELGEAQEWRRTTEASAEWQFAKRWARFIPKGSSRPASAAARSSAAALFRSMRKRRAGRLDRKLVRASGLFDQKYYLETYADVARAGMDPVFHFCTYGWREGRRPGPKFDTKAYLKSYPDVAAAGMNPLVHYLKFGKSEGRSPGSAQPAPAADRRDRDAGKGGPDAAAGDGAGLKLYGPRIDPEWHRSTKTLAALAKDEELVDGDVPEEVLSIAREALRTRPLTVSVVMPTWNREASVCDAIQSALDQSYRPFEIVVCDDGSEDRTVDVISERFATEIEGGFIRVLRNDHQGVSAARNAGLEAARGEVIAYLDSDNVWRPHMLLLATAALAENDELACVYTALQSHNQDSGTMRVRASHYERRRLLESNFIDLNVFVHRCALYDQYGGFDKSLKRLVDWELIIRYTRNHTPAFIPYMGVDYYLNSKRLQNITSIVPLDENRSRIYRKHFVERVRLGLDTLRLAYVLWDYPALSQTFVINELRWLVRKGYDVKVYFAMDPDKAAELDFEVEAHRVRDVEQLAGLLAEHERNLCHSHFVYPTVTRLVQPACEKLDLPYTFMPHAVDIFHTANRERNRVADMVWDPNCLKVFVYGDFHRRFLEGQGVPREKLAYTFQAVEVVSADGSERAVSASVGPRPMRGVAIGRFIEKKGFAYLIEALDRLPAGDVEILIYGYGELVQDYENAIRNLGVNVKLMGSFDSKTQLRDILGAADFFVAPCVVAENGDMDGFPTVILEAIAAGLPVISTTVSAIPDYLTDGVDAILVEPNDADALADGMRRLISMPQPQRQALVCRARTMLKRRAGIDRTMRTLTETWHGYSVDIFLVTYNAQGKYDNREETFEILRRILTRTTTPFTLTIIDNASDDGFWSELSARVRGRDNVRLVRKKENVFCGPASNIALRCGDAEFAIYVCSKEGFVARHGWERSLIDYMRAHPRVAMAGNPCHLPCHVLGREFPDYALFDSFRMQQFAHHNPERVFTHIQGGAFVMRRSVFAEAGGFNPDVPQDGMDVEMSYFLESKGYDLGRIPEVASISRKTRPMLTATVNESTVIAHPLEVASVVTVLDEASSGQGFRCNICGGSAKAHGGETGEGASCDGCGSTPFGRSVFRLLAGDHRTHRKQPAIAATADGALLTALGKFFSVRAGGSAMADMRRELAHCDGDLQCVVADMRLLDPDRDDDFWNCALASLAVGGEMIFSDHEWSDPEELTDARASKHQGLAAACRDGSAVFRLKYVDCASRLNDTGWGRLGRIERLR